METASGSPSAGAPGGEVGEVGGGAQPVCQVPSRGHLDDGAPVGVHSGGSRPRAGGDSQGAHVGVGRCAGGQLGDCPRLMFTPPSMMYDVVGEAARRPPSGAWSARRRRLGRAVRAIRSTRPPGGTAGPGPALGSSRKTTSGFPASAAARATRCRWPPERRRTLVRENAVDARAARPARRRRPGWRTFAATWRSIHRAGATAAGRRPAASPPRASAAGAGPLRGRAPSTRTVPPSAFGSPSQHSTVVVLPAPLGPRTVVTRPGKALS